MSGDGFVLLVEDDRDLGAVLEETVVTQGYRVRWAPTGKDALACLTGELPGLVLLDWSVPDADPEEIADAFRARGVPVVLATGSEQSRELADRIRARAVLDKPYNLEELFKVLERFLGPPATPAYS
jgi:DNA-binding response OmpR family regulator